MRNDIDCSSESKLVGQSPELSNENLDLKKLLFKKKERNKSKKKIERNKKEKKNKVKIIRTTSQSYKRRKNKL